jgi:hypothetical protein
MQRPAVINTDLIFFLTGYKLYFRYYSQNCRSSNPIPQQPSWIYVSSSSGFPNRIHLDAVESAGFSWRGISPSQRQHTNIHVRGETFVSEFVLFYFFRTCCLSRFVPFALPSTTRNRLQRPRRGTNPNPIKRSVADPRLRPHCHRNPQISEVHHIERLHNFN